MDTFTARQNKLSAARVTLLNRETVALLSIAPASRDLAKTIATENAMDTGLSDRTYAFRKLYVATLELVCDDAASYDLARA